jgi:hypothetical protein
LRDGCDLSMRRSNCDAAVSLVPSAELFASSLRAVVSTHSSGALTGGREAVRRFSADGVARVLVGARSDNPSVG